MSKIEGKQLRNLRLGTSQESSPVDGSIYYDVTNDQIVVRDTGVDILFKKEANLVLNNLSGILSVTKGGTGLNTIASGKLLYASATDTLAPLSLASSLSISGGILDLVPANIDKNSFGGGALSIANGGTNATTAATALSNLGALPIAGGTMTGNLILNGDPSSALQAATKQYVDSVAAGLDPKGSVRAATTTNISLSGTQTIDGVSVIVGDRVLVKNQTTGSQNGIYTVSASVWSRSTDADTSAEVTAGVFVFVEEGTTNADSGWVLTTDNPITLGTTSLTFVQFSGAGQITAGHGLTKTGNTLAVSESALDRNTMGGGALSVANGGTNATTISGARQSLGVYCNKVITINSSPYNVLTTDSGAFYEIDATAGSIIINLPSAATVGAGFTGTFRKTDSSANTVTLTPNGSDSFSGTASYTFTVSKETATILTNGTSNWYVSGYAFLRPLDPSKGGTGQSSYTNGQLLIGNTTGNTLTKSTLTAGTGVSIANGNGSITISTQTGVGAGSQFTSSVKIPTLGNSGTPFLSTSSATYSAIVGFSFNPNVYLVGSATMTFKFRTILAFANTGQGAQTRIFNVTNNSAVTNSVITVPSNQTLNTPLIFTSTTLTTSDFNISTEKVFEFQVLRTGSGAISIYGFEIEIINTF